MNVLETQSKHPYTHWLTFILTSSWVLTFGLLYIANTYFGLHLRLGEDPLIVGNDFTRLYQFVHEGMNYRDMRLFCPYEPVAYGPASFWFIKLFTVFSQKVAVACNYAAFLLLFYAFNCVFFKSIMDIQDKIKVSIISFVCTFFSFAVIYSLDRLNHDIFVFLICLCGLVFYTQKRYRLFILMIAVATAMKLYPIAFFLLLLYGEETFLNKIKRLSAGLLLTLFIALISFYVMPHDIHENIVSFLKEIEFSKYHSLGPQISWVMVYRACMQAFFTDTQIYEHVHLFLGGYSLCLIAVGLLISFLFIFYSNIIRSWEAVCLVSLFAILGPHMSSGYKLIFGFIPIYFMLYYAQYHAEKDRHMIWFSVCFSLLVIAISLFPALFQFFFSAHSLKIMVPAILYMIVFTSIFLMIASRFTRSTQRNLTASPRM